MVENLFIEGKLSKFPGSGGTPNVDYVFQTEPRPYQFECWNEGKDRVWHAIFMQYGTGKSKVFVDTAGYLFERSKIKGSIIVAPKGVYRNWITEPDGEIPKHLPARIVRTIGYYDAKGGKKSKQSLERLRDPKGLAFLLINVESLATEAGIDCLNEFIDQLDGRILMGVDESTTIKNHTAKRTKVAINMGKKVAYRRILTGDPYVDSPLDIYAQFKFLEENALGIPSYVNFRARYADLAPIPGQASRPWLKRVVGFKNLDDLKARVAPHAYFASKDLLGLPPKVYLPPRTAEMTQKQRQAYNDMRMFSIAEIGRQMSLNFDVEETSISFEDLQKALPTKTEGEEPLPTAVAGIVLTQLLRLQQIACGFVVTEDGKETDLCDGHNPRVKEVLEAIEEMGGIGSKVIIWAPFTRSIHELQAALAAVYGKESVVTYHGETSGDDREAAKIAFQDRGGPVHFFIGNQSTAGRGITLTAATGVIYFADTFYNEHRANSEDRAHRYGLDHSVTYQNIRTAPVDDKVTQALQSKVSVSQYLRRSLKDGSWKGLFE